MERVSKKKGGWRRLGRILLRSLVGIFLLIIVLFLLMLTPPVQNFIAKKATNYLQKKLDTKVSIGRLYITLSGKIAMDDLYVEDRQKDTLLSAGELRVNMSFYKLLFKGELDIESFRLDEATAIVKRQLPDTLFNFQFIIDAFDTGDKDTTAKKDSSGSMAIGIASVELNKLRLVYKDVVAGNDVEGYVGHFDTQIDKFDLDKLHFIVPSVNLRDIAGKVILSKPLVIPAKVVEEVKSKNAGNAEPVLQLDLRHISLRNTSLHYRDSIGLMYANTNIGNLDLRPKKIDLANGSFDLGDILLEKTTATVLKDKTNVTEENKMSENDTAKTDTNPLRFLFSSLSLKDIAIKYDDENEPRLKEGMDYSHINANVAGLSVNDFLFTSDSIKGTIAHAQMKEANGFVLEELKTDFLYASNQAYLNNLYLKTPGTELKHALSIRYPSIESLKTNTGNLQVNLQLDNSRILVSDILSFVPALRTQPAFADPGATWYLSSDVTGSVSALKIAQLQVQGLQDTRVDLSGTINGLPEIKNLKANLNIKQLKSSRRNLQRFVPANTLPSNITIPDQLSLSGTVKGGSEDLLADLGLRTSLGEVLVKGRLRNLSDKKLAGYDAYVQTKELDLGTILQDKENLGPVSAEFTVRGIGLDAKTANASLKGTIHSAILKKYNYRELALSGSIANSQAQFDAGIQDPNIHLVVNAKADLSGAYPAVQVNAMIDSIKTQALHLTPNSIVYHGKIAADFPGTNPDSLEGKLLVTESLLVQDDRRIKMDTISLMAGGTDSSRFITLQSDIALASLKGRYKLTEMGTIVQRAIQPYFAMQSTDSLVTKSPYDFTLDVRVLDGPTLQTFVPGLKRMDSVVLTSHFSNASGWSADLKAPAIEVGANRINGLELVAGTNEAQDAVNIKATVQKVTSGKSIELDNTSLTAKLADNNIDFTLNIKDEDRSKYNLSGLFKQPVAGEYEFSLKPEDLLLNYDKWTIAPDNQLRFQGDNAYAKNFVLSKDQQQLGINSTGQQVGSPLEVSFKDFRVATLTGFIQSDSTLIDGTINGKAVIEDVMIDPVFTSDLTVADLRIKSDTVGQLKVLVNNQQANTFNADISITGRGNDVQLGGNYYTNTSTMDMNLDIRKLPMTTAQAFSMGAIRDASGSLNGKFSVKGALSKPDINGELNFDKTGFNLAMFNNYFRIDQDKIAVTNQGFRFDRFQVRDSANNALTLDGIAATTNFTNYKFDLDLRANNFRALNSTKKDNKIFYGQLYFNSNLKITGTEAAPSIDGRIKINEKTKLTVVLPQREPGIADREGIVEFVDMDAPVTDSMFLSSYDSLNNFGFTGADVSVNIEIDKAADLTLVVDEGNGDFLNVKGEALLNATMDPSGEMILAGTYDLEEGAYELSFNAIKRKFLIQKGSKITWGGAPTDAEVNISAKYIANTAPLDLVKGQLGEDVTALERNTYLQKLPFEVMLKMEGKLLQPKISFDIILPDNKSYIVSNDIITTVRTKLEQLRQEEGEMNKQVFALLLLNRFVAENPFNSSTSITAATLARQSVSKLMTEQLNRLADDLVKGVDLNFDVQSSEDYTSGSRADRTDLNVGLSKQLLNDRLTVTVGSNFELEAPQNSSQQANNIAGNIAINYRLSKDGRYQLRAYRKNEYQGVIDGYIIETGVGFIITLDYNKLKEIFQKKKLERQRLKRRQERKQKKAEQEKSETTKPEVDNSPN